MSAYISLNFHVVPCSFFTSFENCNFSTLQVSYINHEILGTCNKSELLKCKNMKTIKVKTYFMLLPCFEKIRAIIFNTINNKPYLLYKDLTENDHVVSYTSLNK